MKNFVLALAASSLLVGSASAQTVTGEKTATGPDLFTNAYATLDLRHYNYTNFENDEVDNDDMYYESRYTLGTKLFKKKLNLFTQFRLRKNTRTSQVRPVAPTIYGEYSALESDFGNVGIYADGYFGAYTMKSTWGFVGANYYTPAYERQTILGKVRLAGDVNGSVKLTGNKERVAVTEDQEGFKLATNGDVETDQKDLSYRVIAGPGVSLEVAGVKGLKVSGYVYHYREYDPVYKYDSASADNASLDSYKTLLYNENIFDISYTVSENVKIANTLYYYTDSKYTPTSVNEEGLAAIVNRAMVTYTLF